MARKSRKNTITAQPTSPAATVWKAALYIRLSVEFNSNKGDSLETQKDIMEAHLALHPDIEIAGVYTDGCAKIGLNQVTPNRRRALI